MEVLIGYCRPCKSYSILANDLKRMFDKNKINSWFVFRETIGYPVRSIDYLIIFDSCIEVALLPWLLKRLLAKKVVFWGDFEGTPYLSTVTKAFLNMNIVISASKFFKRCLNEIGVKVDYIIPRWINPERLQPYNEPLIYKPYFLWVAGVDTRQKPESRKGEKQLIKIWNKFMEKYDDIYLVAVSDFPFENYCKNIIRFNFGELDDHKLATLYRFALAYLHTSHCEGFGMPPLEAMYLKCPLVYLDTPAVNEFAVGLKVEVEPSIQVYSIHGGLYQYYKFDVDEYVKAMEETFKSNINDLIEKARRKSEEYIIDKVYRKLLEVL
ncbi:MAG: glycosyltransferase [archaeon GB-1867-035]|nr:glycosyltransferase [Candidatus Culexmicrobium profundum]